MKTAKLVAYVKVDGKDAGELRLAEKGDVWPGYDQSVPLQSAGYWYGTHGKHEYLGKNYEDAKEIIENNYGATLEELKEAY